MKMTSVGVLSPRPISIGFTTLSASPPIGLVASNASGAAPCRSARYTGDAGGRPGRPTRASAVSSATETTVACEKCRDKGTAQSIMLPMSVVPMIASFFMRFLSCVTCVPPTLKPICLRWPRALR